MLKVDSQESKLFVYRLRRSLTARLVYMVGSLILPAKSGTSCLRSLMRKMNGLSIRTTVGPPKDALKGMISIPAMKRNRVFS